MEAVPRLPMISFDLKVSSENASFGTKLKQYIAEFYREDPESYNNEIHQLEGLRSAAVRPAIDLTGCSALKRYFCQLRSLQSRFPMSKGQPAAIPFAWRDLFANIVCTLADVRFEMVCVLYNIGALHSKLGAAESRATQESMKAACTHFQNAVWAFQHLKEHYPQPTGVDLSPEIMKLFQDICLAQAQECILEKSMQDNRKPAIVGAIGMQVLQYYKSALIAIVMSQSSESIHETVGVKICNSWTKSISFKTAYMGCIVYLFQGMQSEEQQRMGERVAFYQAACDRLQEAKKLSKGMAQIEAINEALTFTNDVVEGKRKAAKNENEFIYHEEVPGNDLLTEPKPASLAKGIAFNVNDPEVSGPDIFGRLVPMGAHEASSMYSEEKAKLLRKVGSAVEMKDAQLGDFMSSLQLDQLDALNQVERLPQDLVDRCASLSVKTDAIQNLVETMNSLADIHTNVETMLNDIRGIITEEESSEKEFQQVMGARPPSIVSTELSREANKYLEAHNIANESNQTLHKAMTLHLANLRVLALPLDEIESHVPSLESIKGTVDTASMNEMRSLVAKVNEMQTQRNMLLMQLREAVNADDITSQLLTKTNESLDQIFNQEIEKHSKHVKLLEQNMVAQENILKAVTDTYAKYATARKLISDVLRKRQVFLTALITSYDTYEDLLNKSLKGIEFYRKLSGSVSRLLTRVKSTCKVQEEERAQHLVKTTAPRVNSQSAADSHPDPLSAPALPPASVSSAPKLKDFLPYMKNRTSAGTAPVADPGSMDPSPYSGRMYPPYIRPAPVGSEGSDSLPPKYSDDRQAYGVVHDGYKSYQYAQQPTGQYSAQPYSERPPPYSYAPYENPNLKNDYPTPQNVSYQYYQTYDAASPMESVNSDGKYKINQSDNGDMKPNTFQGVGAPYLQGQMVPPQYNQSAPPSYSPAVSGAYQTPPVSYGAPVQPDPNISYGNPTTQCYPGYAPPTYSPAPVVESKDAATYGSDLPNQMQNMNINYSTPNQPNMYAPAVSTVPPSFQASDASLGYGPNSQTYPQSTTEFSSSGQQADGSHLAYANQNSSSPVPLNAQYTYSAGNIPQVNFSSAPVYSNYSEPYGYPNAVVPTVSSGTSGYPNAVAPTVSSGNPTFTPEQNSGMQIYNPPSVNSDSQSVYNPYANPQSIPVQSHIAAHTGGQTHFNPANTENAISSHANSYAYSNTTDGMYPSNNFAAIPNNSNNYQPTDTGAANYSYNYNDGNANADRRLSDVQPIQSHVQRHFIESHAANDSTDSRYYNPQYSADPAYNTEVPQSVSMPSTEGNNMPPQQYNPANYSSAVPTQPAVDSSQNNSYPNHPGYSLNNKTGTYDYNYGYQNCNSGAAQPEQYASYKAEDGSPQTNLYTSAGSYGTVQTNSGTVGENDQVPSSGATDTAAYYYPMPHYGQQNEATTPVDQQVDQATYHAANNQSSPVYMTSNDTKTVTTSSSKGQPEFKSSPSVDTPNDPKVDDPKDIVVQPTEVSAIDLLSGLDFSVEQKPLMPEIRVPPVSELVIRKVPSLPDETTVEDRPLGDVCSADTGRETYERPLKRDLFGDPGLLNNFTQEVKSLQLFVDGFTKKTHSGITMLDSKWKKIQDAQAKDNLCKTSVEAKNNAAKNASPDVIPYDDSRVILKTDSHEGYVNASHVKQISSWCVPMIVSDLPSEDNYSDFWHMILYQKVAVIVCLLTEIELQGKFYGPTAKNQKQEISSDLSITLDEINCNVNWTERQMTIQCKNLFHKITHYQINVFPARVVSAPLVLLVDKVLTTKDENINQDEVLPKTVVHCGTGAGRSALIVILTMVMCQVRAGFTDLRDMIDSGFLYLCGTRTNVLEDTKYLVDIYRTVLFFVQGVLCSGTVMFNGEAVSMPSGASVAPSHIPQNPNINFGKQSVDGLAKFSKESFEEMKQAAGLKSGDMKDPLSYLDPLWSLKKRKE